MPKAKQTKPVATAKRSLRELVHLLGWITGVLVALAVGYGMKNEVLTIPLVQPIVPLAGWIVIILTLVGVVMAIIDKLR